MSYPGSMALPADSGSDSNADRRPLSGVTTIFDIIRGPYADSETVRYFVDLFRREDISWEQAMTESVWALSRQVCELEAALAKLSRKKR